MIRRRFVLGVTGGVVAVSWAASQWLAPVLRYSGLTVRTPGSGRDAEAAQAAQGGADSYARGDVEQTWSIIDGIRYGAMPDHNGPIGGHKGYQRIISDGTRVARTYSEVRRALAAATEGDIVFIPGEVSIDLTPHEPLVVPEGVVVASNRGSFGSKGALFWSDARESDHSIELLQGCRMTGLRIRGPFHEPETPKTGSNATRGVLARGNGVEVDNCEIYDQLHAGVYLRQRGSTGHDVHHNYIHHCWGEGLGYGVLMNGSSARIHHNLFNANRHSTAHNGRYPSGYVVEENVCLELMVTHCFDMHSSPEHRGPGPSGDGGRCAVMICRNNTTKCVKHYGKDSTRAIVQIRGRPYTEGSLVENNWLWHPVSWEVEAILRARYGGVVVGRNLWAGPDKIVR